MKRFRGYLFVAAGLAILLALVHTLATPASADKEKYKGNPFSCRLAKHPLLPMEWFTV